MGGPHSPTLAQLEALRKTAALPTAQLRRSRTAPRSHAPASTPWHSSRSADSLVIRREAISTIKFHRYCLWNPRGPFRSSRHRLHELLQTKPVRAFSAISSVIPRSIQSRPGCTSLLSGLKTSTKLYFRPGAFRVFFSIVRRTRSVSAAQKGQGASRRQGTMLPSIAPSGAARPMPRIHERVRSRYAPQVFAVVRKLFRQLQAP